MTHDPKGPDRDGFAEIDPLLAETLWAAKRREEDRIGPWDIEAELVKARAQRKAYAGESGQVGERRGGLEKGGSGAWRERALEGWRLRRGMAGLGTRTLRSILWSAGAVGAVVLMFVLSFYRAPNDLTVTRTYVTQPGQQASFTLIDGTHVTLAPRTTLRIAQFGSASRRADLDGQAYFEVTRSARAPFLVRTGTVATQVLGTSFLVRHYAHERNVHIAVAEGKVRVVSSTLEHGPLRKPLTLTAGHVGDIADSTVLVNTVDDLTPETDWMRGWLVFRHAPLNEVLQTLSRWYGYQFRCSDSAFAHRSVTLALNAHSSAKALSTLERILSVHLTVVGDTVTLSPHEDLSSEGMTRKQAYDVWIPTREAGR